MNSENAIFVECIDYKSTNVYPTEPNLINISESK